MPKIVTDCCERVLKAIFIVACIAAFVGCASNESTHENRGMPANAQLSLSPDGNLILVTWRDQEKKLNVRLISVIDGDEQQYLNIGLPDDFYTGSFSNDGEWIIYTTAGKNSDGSFQRINIRTGKIEDIYKNSNLKRFPIEMGRNDYVFLEHQVVGNVSIHQWMRLVGNDKRLLNNRGFQSAAPLNSAGNSLFILTPGGLYSIFNSIPDFIQKMVDKDVVALACSDGDSLRCSVNTIFPKNGKNLSHIMFYKYGKKYRLDYEYFDVSELRVARSADRYAFLSRKSIDDLNQGYVIHLGGPRNGALVDRVLVLQ